MQSLCTLYAKPAKPFILQGIKAFTPGRKRRILDTLNEIKGKEYASESRDI